MDKLVSTFKALSDRNRLRIVSALLTHEELCACQLTELIQVAGATTSRHMGILLAADLVQSRKEGRWVYYRLKQEHTDFSSLIEWIGTQLSQDPNALRDAEQLKIITSIEPDELCRKQRGEACCPGL